MKRFISILLSLLFLIPFFTFQHQQADALGAVWVKEFYKDKFGDKTEQYYLTNKKLFKGTYNSDSVTEGKLGAELVFEREGSILHTYVILYPDGKNQLKNGTAFGKEYEISLKRADGSQFTTTGTLHSSDDRISVLDSLNMADCLLTASGDVPIYIEDVANSNYNYLFNVKCGNFKELFDAEIITPYQEERYQEAEQLLADKQFDEAAVIFDAISDYKDSADRLLEVREAKNANEYEHAEELLNQKRFSEAISAFMALGDYKDSALRVEESKNALAYAQAEEMLKNKEYENAIAAFTALGEFRDSADRIEEVKQALDDHYEVAEKFLSDGDYDQAIAIFEELGSYRDSNARVEEAKEAKLEWQYSEAKNLMDGGNYKDAISAFKMLNGYKDSDTQIENCYICIYSSSEAGDILKFGTYEQDNNTSNGKEDIEWLVLAKENNRLLVISRYGLDCQPYNTTNTSVTWETCKLREWLNGTFLNDVFSAEEQAMIPTVTVSADKNPSFNTNPGNAVQDKIFLLSIPEANKYFSTDEARKCAPTDYAKTKGLYTSDDYKVDGRAACWWWLRSPGVYSVVAAYVDFVGSVSIYGDFVYHGNIAVRPALWINLGS